MCNHHKLFSSHVTTHSALAKTMVPFANVIYDTIGLFVFWFCKKSGHCATRYGHILCCGFVMLSYACSTGFVALKLLRCFQTLVLSAWQRFSLFDHSARLSFLDGFTGRFDLREQSHARAKAWSWLWCATCCAYQRRREHVDGASFFQMPAGSQNVDFYLSRNVQSLGAD